MPDRPDDCTIPIISMTANTFAEDVQSSLDAGMNTHIAKSIVMNEIIRTISRTLHGRQIIWSTEILKKSWMLHIPWRPALFAV